MNRDFRLILENNDLSPNDGWVVLQKSLGCETYSTAKPYVIFYNYYRGLIRIFALHTYAASSSYGLTTVEWMNSKRSAALTYSNIYSRANDQYPEYNKDMVMLQVENYAKDQWWVGEFQVAFDERTNLNQSGYFLQFRVYNVINSDLEFTSTVDLTAKSLEIKGEKDKKNGKDSNQFRQWAVEGNKAIEKLNYGEWDEYLKKSQEVIGDTYWWATQQWSENESFGWLVKAGSWTSRAVNNKGFVNAVSKGAKAIGEVSTALDFMVDFIDFFVGKPSSSSQPTLVQLAPLQVTGTISSEGTIKTTNQQYNYTLALPGTNVSFPYYNCPLGVLNLKSTPDIGLRRWETNNKSYLFLSKRNIYHYNGRTSCSQFYDDEYHDPRGKKEIIYKVTSNWAKPKEEWKSIRLKNNLELAINSASKLELVKAEVAFVGAIKKTNSEAAYDLFEKYELIPDDVNNYRIYYPSTYALSLCDDDDDKWKSELAKGKWITVNEYSKINRWINYTFDKVNNQTYLITEGGEKLADGSRNKNYKFRTAFVDITKAKGLTFTVREETDVVLKIKAIFKEVDNDNAPLMIYTNEYVIEEGLTENDLTDTPYPFIRNQLSHVNIYNGSHEFSSIKDQEISTGDFKSGKIETLGKVEINTNNNVTFDANYSITLKPGFSAKVSSGGKFNAKIVNGEDIIDSTPTPIEQIAKYYKDGQAYDNPEPCNCFPDASSLKSSFISQKDTKKVLNQTICKVYPIPCKDRLNLEFTSKSIEVSTLFIYDLKGNVVFQKKISSGFHMLELSHLSDGIYILRINNSKDHIVKKIVIK